jgi:hypothetical protein
MADPSGIISPWERALMAAERVKERVRRAAKALDEAGLQYAVVGGNAVAEWVARADEGAVRNTRDVDLLIRRADLPGVRTVLESAGFVFHQLLDVDMFLDGPNGRPSEAIHILFAGEKVRPDHQHPAPDVNESERATDFQVTSLPALVRMKLLSNRRKDQVHLLDLIGVGLIDATWPARFPPPLGERLQELLDDPNG